MPINVTCDSDAGLLDAQIKAIIFTLLNEGVLQAQLLGCDGIPLGKNAKVIQCCEGNDCGDKPDLYIKDGGLQEDAQTGKKNIILHRSDDVDITIPLPDGTDKYITDFSLANRGGKPVLEITRNDGQKFTAHLPEGGGGGGSGTDDYVTSGTLTVQREKGGEGTRFNANLTLTRKGGETIDIDMNALLSTAMANPEVRSIATINNDKPPVSLADGHFVTIPNHLRVSVTDSSPTTGVDLPLPALWHDPAGTGQKTGEPLLPLVELHWGKPYGKTAQAGAPEAALCYVKADGSQGYIIIPGGGSGVPTGKYLTRLEAQTNDARREGNITYREYTIRATMSDGQKLDAKLPFTIPYNGDQQIQPGTGINSITPDTEKPRTLIITDGANNNHRITLPDSWFNGRDGADGKDGQPGKDAFITRQNLRSFTKSLIYAQRTTAPWEQGSWYKHDKERNSLVVARSLPSWQTGEVSDPQFTTNINARIPEKDVLASWADIIPGFDGIAPTDAYDTLMNIVPKTILINAWTASQPFRRLWFANKVETWADEPFPGVMTFGMVERAAAQTFAVDFFEDVEIPNAGGVASQFKTLYRGTMYLRTGSHGDGYFPLSITAADKNYWRDFMHYPNRSVHFHARLKSNLETVQEDWIIDVFRKYSIGKPNHDDGHWPSE